MLIKGERIDKLGPSASTHVPAGTRVIDGSGKWLIPGLVDAHVHIFQSDNPYTRPDAADLTAVTSYAAERGAQQGALAGDF